ncbi:MAG: ATP-binding protein [Roseomonas sp.]|nr:ATP-binding protein [Roseomonas sp.]
MLISFAVENFRSFDARQEVSFVCSALKDDEGGIIEVEGAQAVKLLPALVIYGANAAGKSNLIASLEAMIYTILYSHAQWRPEGRIPTREPFGLDPLAAERPTGFEISFFLDKDRYAYGFSMNDRTIVSEWLYAFPQGSKRKLFDRNGKIFSFGRGLKGKNKLIESLTRENSLFLSAAAQNRHEELLKIYNFFSSISIAGEHQSAPFITGSRLRKYLNENDRFENDAEIMDFFDKSNTGIVGYRLKRTELSEKGKEITQKIGEIFKEIHKMVDPSDDSPSPDFDRTYDYALELEHSGRDGFKAFLPASRESSGTLRLLASLPEIFGALSRGGLVLIDELNLHLHTLAAEQILRLFCSRETNPKGAQLLATVHDTNLLSSRFLRRDQVWFASKGFSGMTELYPLTDFRTRPTEDLELRYLQGRYGAIPH